ncbi:MAG: hypothetical protein FJ267_09500, partial [Planctomycetes bacterium]|nr:hypothetical protein [Planctomycetota bacterium]
MKRILLGSLTAILIAGILAAVQQKPVTVEPTIARSLGAIQPRISPDGKSIVASYQGSIWTVPTTGGVMTRLTDRPGFDIEPVWSPDGQHIAFVNSPKFAAGELKIVSASGEQIDPPKTFEIVGTTLYHKLEFLSGDRVLGTYRFEGQDSGFG